MQKNIELKVGKAAFTAAGPFLDKRQCLICSAIRQQVPNAEPYAFYTTVHIDTPEGKGVYSISNPARVAAAYHRKHFRAFRVNLRLVETL